MELLLALFEELVWVVVVVVVAELGVWVVVVEVLEHVVEVFWLVADVFAVSSS